MARMIRKQFYIEPRHQAILKRMAKESVSTEAEVIRRVLDIAGEQNKRAEAGRREAWEWLERLMNKRASIPVTPGKRTWRRDDAYDRDTRRLPD